MIVSERLSRCTSRPLGRMPMMATSANPMTPSAMAISIMVKPLWPLGAPASLPACRGVDELAGKDAGAPRAGFMRTGSEWLWEMFIQTGVAALLDLRRFDARPAGQAVDDDAMIIIDGIVRRRLTDIEIQDASVVARIEDAPAG